MNHGKIFAAILVLLAGGCETSGPTGEKASSFATPLHTAAVANKRPAVATEKIVGTDEHSVPPSQSQDGDTTMLRSSFDECIKFSEGVTPEMQSCIDAEFEYQDARLNHAYQELLGKLTAKAKIDLEASQKQWLSDRDARCEWDASDGGQGQRLEANDCFLELTAQRAAELEAKAN